MSNDTHNKQNEAASEAVKIIDNLHRASSNPYSLHYAQLKKQVLGAASACRQCLDDAGIELTEGWLIDFIDDGGFQNNCQTHLTRFDILKHLHSFGELSINDNESLFARMQPFDVFFALALRENEAASYLFSSKALTDGWEPTSAVRYGLEAAVSAANAYMFGLSLKTSIADHRTRLDA
jgi:hypothetical protein